MSHKFNKQEKKYEKALCHKALDREKFKKTG
jgi:hypothetical protein